MNFFIALGIGKDEGGSDDGVITEDNSFVNFILNGYPKQISIFYIGY